MNPPILVTMVEDHPDYRKGIRLALDLEEDLELLDTFGTAERALRSLQNLAERREPHVLLLDLNLPGMPGLEALPYFLKTLPATKIIILTQSDREDDVWEAIAQGASGYLLKSSSVTQITDAIRAAMKGGTSLDANVARYLLERVRTAPSKPSEEVSLSERETEILTLLGEGLLKKEIAQRLSIGESTVATHVRHIYEKLDVQNAPAAITKAFKAGILRPDS